MSAPELFYDGPRFSDRALCAEVGGDLWFPEGQGADARPAKAICARCPVIAECLQWALEHDEAYGVWGGTTPRQRARMRNRLARPRTPERQRASIAHGTPAGYKAHYRRGEKPVCEPCIQAEIRYRDRRAS